MVNESSNYYQILLANSEYYGLSISELMEKTGAQIATKIIDQYGRTKSIAFLIGLGGNGGDGLATARHLYLQGYKGSISVYLIGRPSGFLNEATARQWELLKSVQSKYQPNPNQLHIQSDCTSKDIANHQIIVEAIVGTGFTGSKLSKRPKDVVSRVSHFRNQMIAMDKPTPGYSASTVFSVSYPKTSEAVTIAVDLPESAKLATGPGHVKALFAPKQSSYKSQNGKLLIIAGSSQYHGSLLLAASAAGKYAGLVYIYTVPENRGLIPHIESELAEFIEVSDAGLADVMEKVDAVLLGSGWEDNLVNKALLNYLLQNYPLKPFVIDASAMGMIDLELVKQSGKVIFTPHRGEISLLTGKQTIPEAALKRFCLENNCYINLKGSTSLVTGVNPYTSQMEQLINTTGNAGLAKGGTGDILAGFTAALATKNHPWLSTAAAAFLVGVAGDLAMQSSGTTYSASDTVSQLGPAWKMFR